MFLASVYMRKNGEKDKAGWSNVEIYSSYAEFKEANPDVPVLVDLDPGYSIAKHPSYVFRNGTNILSVSNNEKTVHRYMGFDIIWVAGANRPHEIIDFDSLPVD